MMKSNEIRTKLNALEGSLSPRQAIILAMENARARFNSWAECAAWLEANPDERLLGDPRDLISTCSERLKKEKPLVVLKSLGRELAERTAFGCLWLYSNSYVGEVTERQLLRLSHLAHRNELVMEQIQCRRGFFEAWKMGAAQPYVLDCRDAAAIEAATAHQVQLWDTFLTGDLPSWIQKDTAAEPAEGTVAAFEA